MGIPDSNAPTSIEDTATIVEVTPEENNEHFSQESDEIGSNDDSLSGSTTKGNEGDGEEVSLLCKIKFNTFLNYRIG